MDYWHIKAIDRFKRSSYSKRRDYVEAGGGDDTMEKKYKKKKSYQKPKDKEITYKVSVPFGAAAFK